MSFIQCRKCGETIQVEDILRQGCTCGYERRDMISSIEINQKNAQVSKLSATPVKYRIQ